MKALEDYSNNVIGYIISGIAEGLFIMVVQDRSGGHTHTIGIGIESNAIYDYMETHKLQLSHENYRKYCEPNYVFERFYIAAELRNNKVREKILKMK